MYDLKIFKDQKFFEGAVSISIHRFFIEHFPNSKVDIHEYAHTKYQELIDEDKILEDVVIPHPEEIDEKIPGNIRKQAGND